MLSLAEVCLDVLKKKQFLDYVNVFLLFPNCILLGKGLALPSISTSLNLLHLKMICAKIGLNSPCDSGEEHFCILSIYFRYFVIILPREKYDPSFEQTPPK